jgi:ATP-grasp ribosomal peptide maturase
VTVLVVTEDDDDTATRVCRALEARGCDYARLDLGDFPEKLTFTAAGPGTAWDGQLSDGQRHLTLADIEAVYWRRPTNFRLPANLGAQQRRFAVAEARQGLGGLISSLPVPFINHPARIADAELKPVQLRAAVEIGFVVPPTLITSCGPAARQFAERFGRVLYKPLTSIFLRENAKAKLVYATLVRASEIDDASIALSACQFQAFIPKSHDIRLVAVGRECFAVAIRAGSDKSYVDWRSDYPALSYEAVDTPPNITEAVAAYLERFGLTFGCFDFAVSADTEEWFFLECGANAQWGWLEHETGLPIGDAIARHLNGDTT